MVKQKFKKEKHIKQRFSERTKLWSFQVYFVYSDNLGQKQNYTATFNEKDFINSKEAFEEACKHRDKMLYKLHTQGLNNKIDYPLSNVYELTKNLYPLRLETYKKLDLSFKKYILKNIGDKSITKVTTLDIYKTLNDMVSIASDDTIQRVFTIWKKIFHTARVYKFITNNITEEIIVPKSEKIRIKKDVSTNLEILNQVIDLLIKHTKQDEKNIYNTNIIIYALKIMYYTGLRPAECFALTKEDIDLNNNLIFINKEIGSSYTEFNVIRHAKTEKSNRIIPILEDLKIILKDLIKYTNYNFVLADYSGKLFDVDVATNKIYGVCKKGGIKFNMYMLRHQFSTNLITNNIDPRTVMELMGHNNISMTIEYARSDNSLKEEALKSIKKIGKN